MSVGLHERSKDAAGPGHITFAPNSRCDDDEKRTLHIPGPRERENGKRTGVMGEVHYSHVTRPTHQFAFRW